MGDVSWVVPTAGFTTACWVPGTSAHSWQAVAAGGTTIGRKGMVLAARVLAATGCDLFESPALLASARDELARRRRGIRTSRCSDRTRSPPWTTGNARVRGVNKKHDVNFKMPPFCPSSSRLPA